MVRESENPANQGDSFPQLSAVAAKIEIEPGTVVDRYVLEEKIGAGGMGAVYLARHTRLKSRRFAVKFIRPDLVGNDVRQRFEAEIDALEKVQHPNFVFAHDAGTFNNLTYLVMEYVDGFSLTQLLKDRGTLKASEAAEIVRQTASGLQHALEKGLVHRDIKPSNIVLSRDGVVKILDLGLARFCDPQDNQGLTGSLQILGTPDYMSPEQCRSSANVDIRSDIYSLGCTLYRLVTGRAPFGDDEHSSIANKLTAHLSTDPPSVQDVSPEILPSGFVAVIEKMMAKDPSERYQTPDQLRLAITPFADKQSTNSLTAEMSPSMASHTITQSINSPSVETDVVQPLIQPISSSQTRWLVGAGLAAVAVVAAYFLSTAFSNGTPSNLETAKSDSPVPAPIESIENQPSPDPLSGDDTPAALPLENKDIAEDLPLEPNTPIEPSLDKSVPEESETESDKPAAPIETLRDDVNAENMIASERKAEPTVTTPKESIKTEPRKSVPRATDENLAVQVKQIFRNRCFECHGDERKEADLNLMAWDTYVGDDESVIPEDADGSYLFERVATDDEDYRMPELPMEALSQPEIEIVRQWIEAGAPKFPEDVEPPQEKGEDVALKDVFGAEYVLTQISEFIESQPRDDRPYFRFFSSNHVLTAGATQEELLTQRQALSKAINHLSMQPQIVRPTVVDEGLATVFAVDIRKLGWHQRPYRTAMGKRSKVDLFDLVLLEYPYSLAFADSPSFEKLWELFMDRSEMVRPIPYVRVDWFVSVATQFPLYEDLLQIPSELSLLEEMLGVDSEMNMHDHVAQRAGMTVSGVSKNNRVVERHPARYGAYWKSYDFETSRGRQNMFIDPMHFNFAGGEMIFNLPNGLQGYLITDTQGKRINAAPTEIVTDKFAADNVVRNGLACMRCHDKGMKRFADNIRPAIESLPFGSMKDKKEILRTYPTKSEMDALLDLDEQKFLDAMEEVLGEPSGKDPLAEVARNFMDNAIALKRAASEVGLKDAGNLESVFALPQFTRFGLAGLTQGGVVRRDTWEDYYDRIVRSLGIGIPIAPVDGLIREDHLADGRSELLVVKTNKRSNIFSPGDKAIITIENNTGVDLFIEVIGTSVGGKINEVTGGVISLPNGQSKKLPNDDGYTVQPKLGTEKITVYASPHRFEKGTLLTAKDDSTYVADRFIHGWYQYDPSMDQPMQNSATQLIKKTLKIDTK